MHSPRAIQMPPTHTLKMPGNGPKWPAVPFAVPRPCLPIAASPAPATARPSEYQCLLIQLFKEC